MVASALPYSQSAPFLQEHGLDVRRLFEQLFSNQASGRGVARDLLRALRRLEARGEIRGGRFVSGMSGEQFALPEAVESLRALRRATGHAEKHAAQEIRVSAADPLNLVGVVLPGARVPAVPTNYVVFRGGVPIRTGTVRDPDQRDRSQAGSQHREAAESGKLYYWQREPALTRRPRS